MALSKLDQIAAEPDLDRRLELLTEYIDAGEQALAKAREARLTAVSQGRTRRFTWRHLASVTGLSEQYLRRMLS